MILNAFNELLGRPQSFGQRAALDQTKAIERKRSQDVSSS